MLSRTELLRIARARIKDSEALFKARRYDGAICLCGYAVEMALKARICKTLRWDGFPSTNKEFQDLISFRTHNLDVLLKLSGVEKKITENYFSEWSIVLKWNPETRYKQIGSATNQSARQMIDSAVSILRVL